LSIRTTNLTLFRIGSTSETMEFEILQRAGGSSFQNFGFAALVWKSVVRCSPLKLERRKLFFADFEKSSVCEDRTLKRRETDKTEVMVLFQKSAIVRQSLKATMNCKNVPCDNLSVSPVSSVFTVTFP
jgi:hypothetical protein